MSASTDTSISLFEAEPVPVESENGSEAELRFARPSYLRFDDVTKTLYVGFAGSAFPVDSKGAFTNETRDGSIVGLSVNFNSVLSALQSKACSMSKKEWNRVLKNQSDSLSILSNAMQQALGKVQDTDSEPQSTVRGYKLSMLLSQDPRPPSIEECCTFASASWALPNTVIRKQKEKNGKQSLHITVTLPHIRDTRSGTDVFVGQRIVDNVANSLANALSTKFASQ
jgi:hypothetical protein